MITLALDTATEILSVALHNDPGLEPYTLRTGRQTPLLRVYTATRDVGLRHSHVLMPLVSRLLVDADLRLDQVDLVACTRGPGSFTGLRIGMATAKGLAAAIASARGLTEPPLVSVSTLEVMAHAIPSDQSLVVPVIDGRKNRFYAAVFHRGVRLTPDLDLSATEIMDVIAEAKTARRPENNARAIVTGPHAALFATRIDDPSMIVVDPASRRGHAEPLIPLAITAYQKHGPDASGQGPVYVRESDAQLSRPKT
ncbi:MAG: tRNA (adenosine(37)-N6)-threonylcarbamoyltransferase complex dimerization subunit type 1 TsaB [Spirochaetaceae bacterium]|nr:tRNA (adenosine(37)-N6)-threonylcarbamoyltransferase complex dimerization subunit type 1 TsaB [Spirochaetaceae bacterium]